jgi:hypothetical protein
MAVAPPRSSANDLAPHADWHSGCSNREQFESFLTRCESGGLTCQSTLPVHPGEAAPLSPPSCLILEREDNLDI